MAIRLILVLGFNLRKERHLQVPLSFIGNYTYKSV